MFKISHGTFVYRFADSDPDRWWSHKLKDDLVLPDVSLVIDPDDMTQSRNLDDRMRHLAGRGLYGFLLLRDQLGSLVDRSWDGSVLCVSQDKVRRLR